MTIEQMTEFFLWCSVINFALLLWWFAVISLARDWVFRVHTRWYKIPAEEFDAFHYKAMAFYKIAIFMLNLVPYIALRIIV